MDDASAPASGQGIQVIGEDVYEWRRPLADGASSITAAKRGSARLAADAANVAIGALAAVSAEAEAQLPDPGQRQAVVGAYVDRLIRSDLAGPVARAVARGDDGADELFDAVLAFLDAAPAGLVRTSRAVIEGLVLDPLDFWVGAPAATRASYLSFLRDLVRRHPEVRAAVAGASPTGIGLGLLAPSSRPRDADAVASLVFALRWPAAMLRRSRRRGRRRLRAPQNGRVERALGGRRLASGLQPRLEVIGDALGPAVRIEMGGHEGSWASSEMVRAPFDRADCISPPSWTGTATPDFT